MIAAQCTHAKRERHDGASYKLDAHASVAMRRRASASSRSGTARCSKMTHFGESNSAASRHMGANVSDGGGHRRADSGSPREPQAAPRGPHPPRLRNDQALRSAQRSVAWLKMPYLAELRLLRRAPAQAVRNWMFRATCGPSC